MPGTAQPVQQSKANASYTNPATGETYYYYVPPPTVQGNAIPTSGFAVSQLPAASGQNQLPAWIQSELQSGEIISYTNPATRQTFYAPKAFGTSPLYNAVWVSGPGYSGPTTEKNGTLYINNRGSMIPLTTNPTDVISSNGDILYNGSVASAPHIEYNAQGEFSGLMNVLPTSNPAAPFSNYQTFKTAGGTVSLPTAIQDGPITETGTWAPNEAGGFIFTPSAYQFSNGGSTITLTNPTLQELESYGISEPEAKNLLQGVQTFTLTLNPSTGAITGSGKYNPPSLTFEELDQLVNSGVLSPAAISRLPAGATVSAGGRTYTAGQLAALYNAIHTPNQASSASPGLSINSSPNAYSQYLSQSEANAPRPALTTPEQPQQQGFLSNILNPAEAALAPVGNAIENYVAKPAESAFNSYIAKPFQQYVAQPASRALSSLVPQTSAIPKNIRQQMLFDEAFPTLVPYAQNFNGFLSGVQGGINKLASTQYNPGNILSLPYLENQVGSYIKTIEQFVGHPIQTASGIPGEMAKVQNIANYLVQRGDAPSYLPEVTLAMMGVPLAAGSLGGLALGGGSLLGAGLVTGIGAGTNYLTNALLQGQWTGPQALQNAETGALTGAIISPLVAEAPLYNTLASRGFEGLPSQIISNIPTFGSWAALNSGLSAEAQGNVPSPLYLGENFGLGAAVGAALPFVGVGLSNIGFRLPEYIPDEASPDTSAKALVFRFFGNDYPLISRVSEDGEVNYHLLNAGQFSNADALTVESAANNMNRITTDFANKVVQNTLKDAVDSGEIPEDVATHYIETLDYAKKAMELSKNISKPSEVNLHMDHELYSPEEIARMNDAIKAIKQQFGLYGTSTVGINLDDVFAQAGQDLFRGAHDIDIQTLPLSTADPAEAAKTIAQIMGPNYQVSPDNPDVVERISDHLKVFDLHGSPSVPGEQPPEIPKTEFGLSHKGYINIDGIKVAPLYNTILDKTFSSLTPRINLETGEFEVAPAAVRSTESKSDLADLYAIMRAVVQGSGGDPSQVDIMAQRAQDLGFMPKGAYENAINNPNIFNTAMQQVRLTAESEGLSTASPYSASFTSSTPYQYSSNTSPSPINFPYSLSPSFSPTSANLMPSIGSPAASSLYSVSPSVSLSGSPSVVRLVSPSINYTVSPSSGLVSPSPSASPSPSPSASPSPSPSYPYYKLKKPLMLPYEFPYPLGAEAYAHPFYPEQVANIYNPSLLPLLLPGAESVAEQTYSPLTATTTFRPIINPVQGRAVTSYPAPLTTSPNPSPIPAPKILRAIPRQRLRTKVII